MQLHSMQSGDDIDDVESDHEDDTSVGDIVEDISVITSSMMVTYL